MTTTTDADVMARLRLNMDEIWSEYGSGRAFESPPSLPILTTELPISYGIPGPTVQAPEQAANRLLIARGYLQRVLVFPFNLGIDDPTEGAEANRRALPLFAPLHVYFAEHPRLHVGGYAPLGMLAGVHQNVTISDSGLVERPGPGGGRYAAIDLLITVVLSRPVRRLPTAYS
jgi:hypothetical protein